MKNEIIIEKGVPLPPKNIGRVKKLSPYTTAVLKLEIGDSFVINKKQQEVYPYLVTAKKICGAKYTARKIDENSCRVWRIE